MGETIDVQLKKLQIKQDLETERFAKMEQTLDLMNETLSKLGHSEEGTSSNNKPVIKKSIRSEMPKFNGSNVHGWIYKAKKYLRFHNAPDEERVTVATFNIEGEALDWLVWADRNSSLSSWSNFLDDLILRFGVSSYEIPAGRLSKLVQITSVKEYQHQFEALANKVDDIKPNILKEMFMASLKSDIQKDVIKVRPDTLVEAFALAQLYEEEDMSTDIGRYCPPQSQFEKGSTLAQTSALIQALAKQFYAPPHKRMLALPTLGENNLLLDKN